MERVTFERPSDFQTNQVEILLTASDRLAIKENASLNCPQAIDAT